MIELSEIRREAGVTQAEMAARLRTTQGSVSQLERRGDVLLSTLSEYLTALGAHARITVTIAERTFDYDLTGGNKR
jgi:transcriptional regulator with XRE-family HTH domain